MGRNFLDTLNGRHDASYEELIEQRGGRLAYAFFRLRKLAGQATGQELYREDLIRYYQIREANQEPGIAWDTPEETEANRLLKG